MEETVVFLSVLGEFFSDSLALILILVFGVLILVLDDVLEYIKSKVRDFKNDINSDIEDLNS